MPDNVENVTLEILNNIQESIAVLTERFDRLEAGMRKDRRNVTGMLVMIRATAGEFEERVSEVEERLAVLEGRPQ
jgi:uncharacterized small protein (DUF1192 family)